ncbi:hypothetical protein BJ742DRAFT_740632 [Cladochytrium replicatum]|nr:hypothetical protein BJ742DRAFT_740632 [Cladochytrium replicatum]
MTSFATTVIWAILYVAAIHAHSLPGAGDLIKKRDWTCEKIPGCTGIPVPKPAVDFPALGSGNGGCGPDSLGPVGDFIVPDFGFEQCCETQGFCYNQCDSTFDQCNEAFKNCTTAVCDSLTGWAVIGKPGCYAAAWTYYQALVGPIGCDVFGKKGQQACDCALPIGK